MFTKIKRSEIGPRPEEVAVGIINLGRSRVHAA
jgi:hypothetical protein